MGRFFLPTLINGADAAMDLIMMQKALFAAELIFGTTRSNTK